MSVVLRINVTIPVALLCQSNSAFYYSRNGSLVLEEMFI
jgi:hypothetical protein